MAKKKPKEPDVSPATQKPPVDRSKDRHKPRRNISFLPRVYIALQMLAKKRGQFLKELVDDISRDVLAENDLWPVSDRQIVEFLRSQKKTEDGRDVPDIKEDE